MKGDGRRTTCRSWSTLSGVVRRRGCSRASTRMRASRYKDRMVLFAEHQLPRDVGPGFGAKAAAQLEADVKAGAIGLGEIFKDFGMFVQEGRRHRLQRRRSRARSGLGDVRAAEHPGVHSRRRAAGVLRAARLQQRALARAGAVSRSPLPGPARSRFEELMTERDRLFAQASEHDVHPGALRLARQRPGARSASCSTRSRTSTPKSAPCSTTSAASRGRRTTSSSSTRTGFCSARTAISRTSIRTTGACSRPTTSTSTTTATITRSGSCTASACRTRC